MTAVLIIFLFVLPVSLWHNIAAFRRAAPGFEVRLMGAIVAMTVLALCGVSSRLHETLLEEANANISASSSANRLPCPNGN
jgi:hypothetical protein